MPAPRQYDEETRARAVRMYQERVRDLNESKLTARRAVGAVLHINPATLRNWVEREEIDTRVRRGVTTETPDELKALRREVAELRRANVILNTASALVSGSASVGTPDSSFPRLTDCETLLGWPRQSPSAPTRTPAERWPS